MAATIFDPTSCEVHAVIRFLHTNNASATEIHRQLYEVYGPNIMSEGVVRHWCRMFKDCQTNIHDEQWVGQPSVAADDVVLKVDAKVRENRCFTITELSVNLPQIVCSVLYETMTNKLGYHKFCTRWVPKMVTDDHKNMRITSLSLFWSGNIVKEMNFMAGDKTWVSYVNPESKQQSMKWGRINPKKPE